MMSNKKSFRSDVSEFLSGATYGEEYYAKHCGSVPYARNEHWLGFFGGVADVLLRSFAPKRAFDAGCALGLLVESFWDRGVEAHGRDISAWAIGNVRADIRPWCEVGSIADPVDGTYDLITCIEVLEHMPANDAERTISVLAGATSRILFSSSPNDFDEPTHINLRPPLYWLRLWAAAGFAPSITHDAGYLAPHAYILERSEEGRSERDLLAFADRIRHRVALSQMGASLSATKSKLAEVEVERAAANAAVADAETRRMGAEAALAEAQQRAIATKCALAETEKGRVAAELALEQSEREIANLKDALTDAQFEKAGSLAVAEDARRQAAIVASNYQAVMNSTVWRMTGPIRHCAELLPLSVRRRARQTLRQAKSGFSARGKQHILEAPPKQIELAARPLSALPTDTGSRRFELLVAERFPDLSPLPTFSIPSDEPRRLTIVTDSVNVGSLYGGVGTALILSALAASRMGTDLRVVTRTEAAEQDNIATVLDAHGIVFPKNIECIYAPRDGSGGRDVPVSSHDFFLTTSWWTTWSACKSIARQRLVYLLQEDERMFYPHGDDHLRCTEMLSDPHLLYLVNSELLFTHLRDQGLAPTGVAFEPAFPNRIYHYDQAKAVGPRKKRKFFFYARPNNPRNLYWRGVEAIAAAITEGVLNPNEWDFYFAGHGVMPLQLPRGVQPKFPGPLAWGDYAALVRDIDVGLCLMYTPHPSYPPLDLAASGAVVVTNRFGAKTNLNRYSENIFCSDLDVRSLVAALAGAAALASDNDLRLHNYTSSGLKRDWETSLAPALDRMVAWAEG